jgi:hypothetical protein
LRHWIKVDAIQSDCAITLTASAVVIVGVCGWTGDEIKRYLSWSLFVFTEIAFTKMARIPAMLPQLPGR